MRIAVVGGKLQGVEAIYLAHKAGYNVTLVDKNSFIPAIGLCDEFHQLDITTDERKFITLLKNVDLIIPAIEGRIALNCLRKIADTIGIPLAYDELSYDITSSKIKSDRLFMQAGIPAPIYWPEAELPVIIKPSGSSGSQGVRMIQTFQELENHLKLSAPDLDHWVIQEYLHGPSYSLEILGSRGKYVTYQVTELEMDSNYDCKRVIAPVNLNPLLEKQIRDTAVKIAKSTSLTGIMDVEVINHSGILKVLEIDARLPSQTPTVVYKSTGINLLEELYKFFVSSNSTSFPEIINPRAVFYEHIRVDSGVIRSLGEHIMVSAGPLGYYENLWGADEVLTSYKPGCETWVATLITTGTGRTEAWTKRCEVIKNIKTKFKLLDYVDS